MDLTMHNEKYIRGGIKKLTLPLETFWVGPGTYTVTVDAPIDVVSRTVGSSTLVYPLEAQYAETCSFARVASPRSLHRSSEHE